MKPERWAVIGDPVAHSLSPVMQAAALKAAGIAGTYQAIQVTHADLPARLQRLREDGISGFNVTIPHKEAIVPLLNTLSEAAATIGAVNTVVVSDAGLIGYNTDVSGFTSALVSAGLNVSGMACVVFGSGGAARAVVHALISAKAQVVIAYRTRSRAQALVRHLRAPVQLMPMHGAEIERAVSRSSLLVNATPMGSGAFSRLSPLASEWRLMPSVVGFDLVYGGRARFLDQVAAVGGRTIDGLEMLVQQGAAAFTVWTGVTPDIDAMRRACLFQTTEVSPCCDS